jgi:hypothetical protein
MKTDPAPPPTTQLEAARLQLSILDIMTTPSATLPDPFTSGVHLKILATLLAFDNYCDIQRYIFILEGQQFVTPVPPGDLTCMYWKATSKGLNALHKLRHVLLAA